MKKTRKKIEERRTLVESDKFFSRVACLRSAKGLDNYTMLIITNQPKKIYQN